MEILFMDMIRISMNVAAHKILLNHVELRKKDSINKRPCNPIWIYSFKVNLEIMHVIVIAYIC